MSKTTQELIDQANANLPDNSSNEISAQDVREQHIDNAQSSFNKVSDRNLVGLKPYSPAIQYEVGDTVTSSGLVWECVTPTTGAWNPSHWFSLGTSGTPYSLNLGVPNGLSISGINPQTLSMAIASSTTTGALSMLDWASFNAKQNALGYTPLNATEKATANGVAPLDGSGVVPFANLPSSLAGALNYLGTYNPVTHFPAIDNGSGNERDYYVVSEGGTHDFGSGDITMIAGDFLIHNGSSYDHVATQGGGVESVQGDTSKNISLGTGFPNTLSVWDNGNKFKSVPVHVLVSDGKTRLGLGIPASNTLEFAFEDSITGFLTTINGGNTSLGINVGGVNISELISSGTGGHIIINKQPMMVQNPGGSAQYPLLSLGASSALAPHIALGLGVAPSTPVAGQIWATPNGLYYRHGDTTVNLATGVDSEKEKEIAEFKYFESGFSITTNSNKIYHDCNFATGENITIHNDALEVGEIMYFEKIGAGLVNIVGDTGVTIQSDGDFEVKALIKKADNLFKVI